MLAGSWGTVLALAYASRYPQCVEGLVLRGAFALSRREVGGLLQPDRQTVRVLGSESFWPAKAGVPLPVVLRRLAQLLQSGTPGVAGLRVARRWSLLESARAERGMRRSARHAALEGRTGLSTAIRRKWAALRRSQRRQLAQVLLRRIGRVDRRSLFKYRIQAHYLRHRGFVRPPDLDVAVNVLAAQGVPVQWVHGRFDAVCPPANSRRWAAKGGQLSLALGGHLGHEPDVLAALRVAVREMACG